MEVDRAGTAFADRAVFVLAIVLFAFQTFSAVITVGNGADGQETLAVFDADEVLGFDHVTRNLADHSHSVYGIPEHGTVFNLAAYALVRLYENHFGYTVTPRTLIVLLRGISLASFVLFALVCFAALCRLQVPRGAAALSVLLITTVPDFYYYAQIIHPDLLQTALLGSAVLLVLAWPRSLLALFFASVVCAAAAATKLNAVLWLPFLPLPYAIERLLPADARRDRRVWLRLVVTGLAVAVVFVIAFCVLTPPVVEDPRAYFARIAEIRKVVGTGWGKTESKNPWPWVPMFVEQVGLARGLFLLGGVAAAVVYVKRNTEAPQARAVGFLLVALVPNLLYLVATVRMREFRYLYHVYPYAVIVAVAAVWHLSEARVPLRGALVVTLVALAITGTHHSVYELRSAANRMTHPRIETGLWIRDNYALDTPALADWYTYRPPGAKRYNEAFLAHEIDSHCARTEYKLLVLSKMAIGRYVWKEPGSLFGDKRWVRDDSYHQPPAVIRAFECFLDSGQWKVVHENDETVVLEHR